MALMMLHATFFFLHTFQTLISAEAEFPCFFIFGDSFVDNGNNNYLDTTVKADYLPYGIDFPVGPTGRFSNGRNIADIMAKRLGFENSIPPFANGTTQDILGGLNYASGGAGILNKTNEVGHVLGLDEQISNHEITISRIKKLLQEEGQDAAKEHLRSCLYYVGIGTNDYVGIYMPQFYSSSIDYTPKQFSSLLITHYSTSLRRLYRKGARKVAVRELGKLGCTPVVKASSGSPHSSSCIETGNDIVQIFNEDLNLLINSLNHDYPQAKFVLVRDNALSPSTGDVMIEDETCCVSGRQGLCVEGSVFCSNRDQYRFLDYIHPTEAAVVAAADIAYDDVSPLFSH